MAVQIRSLVDDRHCFILDTGYGPYQSLDRSYAKLPLSSKIYPIITLVVTTTVSTILIVNQRSKWVFTGNFYIWIKTNTVLVTILINVLAQCFALLQVYTLSTIINHSTRVSLSCDAISLDTLKLWNSVTSRHIDWSLAWPTLILAVCYFLSMLLPVVGWVAAITPTNAHHDVDVTTFVPVYGQDLGGIYWNRSWNPFDPGTVYYFENNSFTFVPGASQVSTLLNSASIASSKDTSSRIHRKSDTSVYNYIGRSYGVGASVGLVNISSPVKSPASQFSFSENGYRTTVNCIYNATSGWSLDDGDEDSDGSSLPNLFMARGPLAPGAHSEGYAVASFSGNSSIVALIAGGGDITGNIAITAGTSYALLDKVQCSTVFEPATFLVSVDTTGRNITISWTASTTPDIDPSAATQRNHRGRLQQSVLWEITRISQRNTNLYSSIIGEALKMNVERGANVSDWRNATQEQFLGAVAESFEAIIDDILLSIAAAEYMVPPQSMAHSKSVPAQMLVAAIVIGTPKAIYGGFIFNIVVILAWVSLCLSTQFWRDAPRWDYRELGHIAVAASRGGVGVAESHALARQDKHVKVQLMSVDGEAALVSANSTGDVKSRVESMMSDESMELRRINIMHQQNALK